VTILPCLLPVFEGERVFPSAATFWPSFFHSFLQFLAAVCQIIALGLIVRPAAAAAAAAPPPSPPPPEKFCNSYYMNESGFRCFFCPLPPPSPTAASAVSKCSERRCNWRFFQNANNSACVAEKWSQLF
jgi:hypothetical protein